jgi:hypothetical protein
MQPDPEGEERTAVVTDKGRAIYHLHAADFGLDPMQFVEPPAESESDPEDV